MARHGRVVKVRWCGGDTLQMGGTKQGHVRSYDGDQVDDRDLYEDIRMVMQAVLSSPNLWIWATTKVGRKLAPGSKVATVDAHIDCAPVVVVFPDGFDRG